MEHMETIEGTSGQNYTPKERNALVYDYFNKIRNNKETESTLRKDTTAKINFIEKEFKMVKGEFKEWVSLKLAELNKSDISKTAAVELDYDLKKTREIFGANEKEDVVERNCSYEENDYEEVEDQFGN